MKAPVPKGWCWFTGVDAQASTWFPYSIKWKCLSKRFFYRRVGQPHRRTSEKIYKEVKVTYRIRVAEADRAKMEKAVKLSDENTGGVLCSRHLLKVENMRWFICKEQDAKCWILMQSKQVSSLTILPHSPFTIIHLPPVFITRPHQAEVIMASIINASPM